MIDTRVIALKTMFDLLFHRLISRELHVISVMFLDTCKAKVWNNHFSSKNIVNILHTLNSSSVLVAQSFNNEFV